MEKTKAKLDVGGLYSSNLPLPVVLSVCVGHDVWQLENESVICHAFGESATDKRPLLSVAEMVGAGAESGARHLRPPPRQRGRGQEGEQREGLDVLVTHVRRVCSVSKLATPWHGLAAVLDVSCFTPAECQ